MNFSKANYIIIAIVIAVAVIGNGLVLYLKLSRPAAPLPNVCTTEVKICPDGSAVGRGGPNCEFAACPGTNQPPAGCSQEAKVCPDGTSVGRTGANCEFALCPEEVPNKVAIFCVSNSCQLEEVMVGAGTLARGCFRDSVECQKALATSSDLSNLIKVDNLKPDQVISSPLLIKGRARGNWYFEAVFPIRVYDDQGTQIGEAQARALGEWTTSDFVPFEATVTFTDSKSTAGRVSLIKSNPSGLIQNDDQLDIPVRFK
jgi:hypothetical protein